MQIALIVLGILSFVGSVSNSYLGSTNTETILAGIYWTAMLVCVVGVGVIRSIDRVSGSAKIMSDSFKRIAERRNSK